jgi:hypothetical protein
MKHSCPSLADHMDTLRGYVRDAEIFKDHAGGCFDINPDTK